MPPPTWLAWLVPPPGSPCDPPPPQAERRAPPVELDHGVLGLVVEDLLAGRAGQRAELEQQRADLGRIAARTPGLAGLQVDEGIRNARRRRECRQQPRPEIVRQPQQPRIAGQLPPREQP